MVQELKNKKPCVIFFSFLLIVGVFVLSQKQRDPCSLTLLKKELFFTEGVVVVEIADTPVARTCGLSYRLRLSDESGMLFVFNEPSQHAIWMKTMRFPIDIIWLDDELRVVDSKRNVVPESYPETFTPRVESSFVLEVVSGFILEHSIEVGEAFSF